MILDVSKAHRRIKIAHSDQGLLCFHHRDRLYQCLTLGPAPLVSTGRGWLVSLRALAIASSLCCTVFSFICVLHADSAPVRASVLVILLCCLGVPMSWHKAALSARPVWIGWALDLRCLTADMEPAKKQRLLLLLRSIRASKLCHVDLPQKLTGKLLWLSALLPALRPSLTPLYSDQYSGVPVSCAVSDSQWALLRSKLDRDLRTTAKVGLPSVPHGSKLIRVANTLVRFLSDLPLAFRSRRLWIQVRLWRVHARAGPLAGAHSVTVSGSVHPVGAVSAVRGICRCLCRLCLRWPQWFCPFSCRSDTFLSANVFALPTAGFL